MQFYQKRAPFIIVLQNIENATAVVRRKGEFEALIPASTVWYEFFCRFHFCGMYFLQFQK